MEPRPFPALLSTGSVFPFRFTHLGFSNEELEEVNGAAGRTGERTFLADWETVNQIWGAPGHPSAEVLEAWVLHPSETVLLTLLDKRSYLLYENPELCFLLYQRVLSTAEVRGELWNPALDLLAQKFYLWPQPTFASERYRDFSFVPHVELEEVVSQVAAWIRKQTDAALLSRLLEYRATPIHEAVARHARCLNPELIYRLLDQNFGGFALSGNPNLTEAHVELIFEWAQGFLRNPENHNRLFWVKDALSGLRLHGHQPPESLLEELLILFQTNLNLRSQDCVVEAITLAYPEALLRPEVRTILRESTSAHALSFLCRDAEGIELTELLQRVLDLDLSFGIVLIDRCDAWTDAALTESQYREIARRIATKEGIRNLNDEVALQKLREHGFCD